MVDMKHMIHLVEVAAGDVQVLRNKEATYQGSWKMSGGRSAWFMLKRNIDRLANMLAPPAEDIEGVHQLVEHIIAKSGGDDGGITSQERVTLRRLADLVGAEDIFAKIKAAPLGEDGTVLAVVRDLRRYLMLVEAEMISRGDVSPVPVSDIDLARIVQPVVGQRRPEPMEELDGVSEQSRVFIATLPVPLEDANKHAERSLSSWYRIDRATRSDLDDTAKEAYWQVTLDLYQLRDHLDKQLYFRLAGYDLRGLYRMGVQDEEMVSSGTVVAYFLDRDQLSEYFSPVSGTVHRTAVEVNRKEWSEMQPWIQTLYRWSASSAKHIMMPEYLRHWAKVPG